MFLLDSGKYAQDPQGTEEALSEILARCEAEVVAKTPWQEGKLAYEVDGHRKGLHYLTYFKMDGSRVGELARICKLSDIVLRHLIIQHPPRLFQLMTEALAAHEAEEGAAVERHPARCLDPPNGERTAIMASYNKVILVGNLTRDPEVKYTAGGTAVTEIGLAVNRNWFDRQSNERKEETTFVDITLWGRQAEVAGEYLSKGRSVLIEGRLQLDTWEDKTSGQKRSKLKVVGENMQMLGGRGEGDEVDGRASSMVIQRKHRQRVRAIDRKGGIEVLLAETVPSLGEQGEIVRVKPGYARNYLVPMGLATIATEENKKMVERHRARQEAAAIERRRELQAFASRVKDYSVTLEANATDEGALYGSIVAADISKSLRSADLPVEPHHLKMDGPIKALGMYTIDVELSPEVTTEVKVWVVPTASIK
ncbi:50S ribosomal protein L9 [Durusdinium trenchii]|uniref:50S ribosomal protein L9, chloroplastic n=1 Tax=Durusdinium trenchii TaxID=1381693 RepID=A0ABP0I430_9DINO